jgi:hypothetical protein
MTGVEVTGDDHGQSRREPFQKKGHQFGTPGLDCRIEIKMGIGRQQMPALFFKPSHHALPGPPGPGHFGRDIWKPGDEIVMMAQAGPVSVKKDHIGLPPGMIPVVPADVFIFFQRFVQKIRLEMIDLLKSDKIDFQLFQKCLDHIPAHLPAVSFIFCQAEPQVHCHHTEECRFCFHFCRLWCYRCFQDAIFSVPCQLFQALIGAQDFI